MTDSANHSVMAQMVQALSSLHLPTEQFQHALQSPEYMMELMKRISDTDSGHSEPGMNEIKQKLEAVEARWQAEARLPPEKPLATKRHDLERINWSLAQKMSSKNFGILNTIVGHEKTFSTIPITELGVGMLANLILCIADSPLSVSIRDMLVRKIHKVCIIAVWGAIADRSPATGAVPHLPHFPQTRQVVSIPC